MKKTRERAGAPRAGSGAQEATSRRASWGTAAVAAMALVTSVVAAAGASSASAATASCSAGSQLSIMAHPDDDIFFMNPDILHSIASSGWCTTTVYLTSGDAGQSSAYPLSREAGVRAAYAKMAGAANTWTSTTVTAAGHTVAQYTLAASPAIHLEFLRLPDGNIDGSGFSATGYASLQKLYEQTIPSITTDDTTRQSYSRAELSSTLGALITSASPTIIRTQDYVHDYGTDDDHSDHHFAGKFVLAARNAVAPGVAITPYLGYPSADLAVNVSGADLTAKDDAFLAYAPYDSMMCQSLTACASRSESKWLPRQHTATQDSATQPDPGTSDGNAAASATVTASSQDAADSQTADKVVDGVIDGYPGDHTAEWATQGGGTGSWVQLSWMEPISLNRVVLFDRPNTSDEITSGTLTFSDGSTVAVPSLTNDGTGVTVTFPAETTTSVRLTITGVSSTTRNVGLAEFQAWTSGSTATPTPTATSTPTPTATSTPTPTTGATDVALTASATASSEATANGQTAAKAIDGVIDGYPGDYTAEWATNGGVGGSYLQLTWSKPVQLSSVVLFDRPNTSDQVTAGTLTFSNGSTVAVPSLTNDGTGVKVALAATTTSSLRFTVTGVSSTTRNVGLSELQAFTPGLTPTPTATPTPTPTATPTPTPTATPTPTPTATPTPTPTATPTAGATNLALTATATASSAATGQAAAKAIDGVIDGYPGNYAAEWATSRGGAGSSLQLTWASAVRLGRIVLYDRPNANDQVTGATITFSDGSTVSVPALDNAGGATTVTFTARSTTSVKITFTSVSSTTVNAGLAEVQAFAA